VQRTNGALDLIVQQPYYCLLPGGHISLPGREFGISVFHTSVAVPGLPQDKTIRVRVVQRTSYAGLFEYFQAALSQKLNVNGFDC
jgi:hypothetical protein